MQRAVSAADEQKVLDHLTRNEVDAALDFLHQRHATTNDLDYVRRAARVLSESGDYERAARWYKQLFLLDGNASDAYQAALAWRRGGDGRKADIWFRVVRRGAWHKAVGRPGEEHKTATTPAAPDALEDAKRFLARLDPGEIVEYTHLKMLEERSEFEEGKRYKREERGARAGESTIAGDWARDAIHGNPHGGPTAKKKWDDLTDAEKQARAKNFRERYGFPDLMDDTVRRDIVTVANAWVVKYARTADERAALQLHPGLKQGSLPAPFDTTAMYSISAGKGWAIFAMSASGKVYATEHRVSRVHHTSPLAGGDVAGAGEISVAGGAMQGVTNKSGHYFPDKINLKQSLQQFQRLGVNLGVVNLEFHDSDGSRVWWEGGAAAFLSDVADDVAFSTKKERLLRAKTVDRKAGATSRTQDPNFWSP